MIKLVDLLNEGLADNLYSDVVTFMTPRIEARLDDFKKNPSSLVSYLWFVDPMITRLMPDLAKTLSYNKEEDREAGLKYFLAYYKDHQQEVYKTFLEYLSKNMEREIEDWFEDEWSDEEMNLYKSRVKNELESKLLVNFVDEITDEFEKIND